MPQLKANNITAMLQKSVLFISISTESEFYENGIISYPYTERMVKLLLPFLKRFLKQTLDVETKQSYQILDFF